MSSMVQVLDLGCPLHFLARKDLQILPEIKIQGKVGPVPILMYHCHMQCNKLLVLAEHPFI